MQYTRIKTVRKEPWRGVRKDNVIRGLPLSPSAGIEHRYYNELQRLIIHMTTEVYEEAELLFRSGVGTEYFAQDANIVSLAKALARTLRQKFEKLFNDEALQISGRLTRDNEKHSTDTLQSSIQRLASSLTLPRRSFEGDIREVIQASIAENVSLIKSIPQKYLGGVEQAMMRSITTGNGIKDMIPYLANSKGITLRRAKFIAEDQNKKIYENISTARMERLGVEEFELLHVASNHPRSTHIAAAGKIYKLSEGFYDPAVKRFVMPGELPGCRCKKIPVIRFDGEH